MEYTESISIAAPVDAVAARLANPLAMQDWLKDVERVELLEGEAGTVGSKSRVSMGGKHKMVMTETVIAAQLPDLYHVRYDANGVGNEIEFHLKAEGEGTLCTTLNRFHFNFFMRIMAFFMRGCFRKQTQANLKQFKDWVEADLAQPEG